MTMGNPENSQGNPKIAGEEQCPRSVYALSKRPDSVSDRVLS